MEPVGRGRARLGRADARPGAVHRLRARLHRQGLAAPRRPGLGRPRGAARRGGRTVRCGRCPDRLPGRVVRRLHDQLGGRAHRPVRRDRHPLRHLGAGPEERHRRRRAQLADAGSAGPPTTRTGTRRTRRTASPTASARRCSSPTATGTTGCRSARRCGCGGTWSAAGTATRPSCRTGSSTSPARTTGSCPRPTPRSGTRPCSASAASTSSAGPGGARLGRSLPQLTGAGASRGRRSAPERAAAEPSTLRGAYPARHSPPWTAAYASSCQGCARRAGAVLRSRTSSAASSVLAVAGSNTSTPKWCAPLKAAASTRCLTTDRVRADGATWKDTGVPAARATAARHRCIRFASA